MWVPGQEAGAVFSHVRFFCVWSDLGVVTSLCSSATSSSSPRCSWRRNFPVVQPRRYHRRDSTGAVLVGVVQFVDKVYVPVVVQRQARGCVDRGVPAPQIMDMRVEVFSSCVGENPWRFHRCSSWSTCTCPLLLRLMPMARQCRKLWRFQRCRSWSRCTCPLLFRLVPMARQ